MRLNWTRSARSDLSSVHEYVSPYDRQGAKRLIRRIREVAEQLCSFPDLGRPGRVPGTRERVVPGTPYLIAYRVGPDTIDVTGVIHGSRQWPDKI